MKTKTKLIKEKKERIKLKEIRLVVNNIGERAKNP